MKRFILLLMAGLLFSSVSFAGGSIFGKKHKERNEEGVHSIQLFVCGSLRCPKVIFRPADCAKVPHSTLQYGVCICDSGYVMKNGQCVVDSSANCNAISSCNAGYFCNFGGEGTPNVCQKLQAETFEYDGTTYYYNRKTDLSSWCRSTENSNDCAYGFLTYYGAYDWCLTQGARLLKSEEVSTLAQQWSEKLPWNGNLNAYWLDDGRILADGTLVPLGDTTGWKGAGGVVCVKNTSSDFPMSNLTQIEEKFIENMKVNYGLLNGFGVGEVDKSNEYYQIIVTLEDIKVLAQEIVDMSDTLSNPSAPGYAPAVNILREKYNQAKELWEKLERWEQEQKGQTVFLLEKFFQNFGIKTAWADETEGFVGDPGPVGNAVQFFCPTNTVYRVSGIQCPTQGLCLGNQMKSSDGECCNQQQYGWDSDGKTFCCKENEIAWPQNYQDGTGSWTCCDPKTVGTSDGKCCTNDRWVYGQDEKVSCCPEGKYAATTGEKTSKGMMVSICCGPDETGTPNGCCPVGRGYTTKDGSHMCCRQDDKPYPKSDFSGDKICCPNETDVLSDGACCPKERAVSRILGNHTYYICCEEDKVAKPMGSGYSIGFDICCALTDNVIDGSCCPQERSGHDEENYPKCCDEKQSVTSDGFCCEEERVFYDEQGNSVCCPDERYGHDENGEGVCCADTEKKFDVYLGQGTGGDDGIVTPDDMGEFKTVCCPSDTTEITDDGQCCTSERKSKDENGKTYCCPEGEHHEIQMIGLGENGPKTIDGCCPEGTSWDLNSVREGYMPQCCPIGKTILTTSDEQCCTLEQAVTMYEDDGSVSYVKCCPDNTFPQTTANGDDLLYNCCPNKDDELTENGECCAQKRYLADGKCCPDDYLMFPAMMLDDETIVYGGNEGERVVGGKCCAPDDKDCICEVDPDNEICKICSLDSVICDTETGECTELEQSEESDENI